MNLSFDIVHCIASFVNDAKTFHTLLMVCNTNHTYRLPEHVVEKVKLRLLVKVVNHRCYKLLTLLPNGAKHGKFVKHVNSERYDEFYMRKGDLVMHGTYNNGKREGEAKLYSSPSGEQYLFATCTYVNGKLEGKKVAYYSDGSVGVESNYIDGKLDGPTYVYQQNGSMREYQTYLKGFLSGVEYIWTLRGALYRTTEYKYGMMHGKSIEYDRNSGEVMVEKRYYEDEEQEDDEGDNGSD